MIKLSYQYNQSSVLLKVEGLPDYSSGQKEGTIGIISGWRIEIIGLPTLEGKREHLEAMMCTILPYARHLISASPKTFESPGRNVLISPSKNGHKLLLKSSKAKVKPLSIVIDDSGLVDLVRCLDDLRLDSKIDVKWEIPEDKPLKRKDLSERIPLIARLAAPVLGISSLLFLGLVIYLSPIPDNKDFPNQIFIEGLNEPEDFKKLVD